MSSVLTDRLGMAYHDGTTKPPCADGQLSLCFEPQSGAFARFVEVEVVVH